MTKFTKDEVQEALNLSAGHTLSATDAFRLHKLSHQLLAGLDQEPVGYEVITSTGEVMTLCKISSGKSYQDMNCTLRPVYAAPQLPQPVPDKLLAAMEEVLRISDRDHEAWHRAREGIADYRAAMLGAEPVQGWIPCSERMPEEIGRYWCYVEEQNSLGKSHYQWNCSWNGDRWWVESENGGRVTHWMPLPAAPQQEVTTDNTTQQLESLGFIVTSDERKMELPRCSKHPETELQVHPFEMLLSYPPKPAMYCPLCRPSVAEWVEFDKQLRQWKEVK